mgnify:CR=1 FL=1
MLFNPFVNRTGLLIKSPLAKKVFEEDLLTLFFKEGFLKILLIPLAIFSFAQSALADTCVECHKNLAGDLSQPVFAYQGDVHSSHNFSCKDCHGGDDSTMEPALAMNPAKGWVGKVKGEKVVEMCARCHSNPEFMKGYNPSLRVDQAELYWTSIHGQRLKAGNLKPATCSSCHSSHGIYKPDDKRSKVHPQNVPATCASCHSNEKFIKEFNIPTNQYDEYKESVHGIALLKKGDLSSPACNDCHGNHGAVPPGIKSIAYVCSQCHPIQQELFMSSPHGNALVTTGSPSCSDCHNKHKILSPTDNMLGIQNGAVCIECHSEGDGGWLVAKLMRERIDTFKKSLANTKRLVRDAEEHGMPSVDAEYLLQQAESNLIKSRTIIHSFTLTNVEAVIGEGIANTDKARSQAEKFLDELTFRKAGLWATWLFIALFLIGIYFKVRDLDRARGKC